MRCPKCGYITFDHLEVCPKCQKNISKISEQLSGNIFKVETPVFLKFKVQEPEMETEASVDIPVEEKEVELEMGGAGDDIPDIEFSLEGEEELSEESLAAADLEESSVVPGDSDSGENELVFSEELDFSGVDLDEGVKEETGDEQEEVVFSEEEDFSGFDLDEEDQETTEEDAGVKFDLSELDIADLAPPAPPAATEENETADVELALSSELEETATAAAPSSSGGVTGAGLEDLQIDGLELDQPTSPSTLSASGKNVRSTAKTGTALDDFDFDLGELLSDKEK